MNEAVQALEKEYTNQLKKSTKTYSTALSKSSEDRKAINATQERGLKDIAKQIKEGQAAVGQFFKEESAKKLEFVQEKIAAFCEAIELAMRTTVSQADYANSKKVVRRAKSDIDDYVKMEKPEVADKMVAAAVNGKDSKVQRTLFEAGYKAVSQVFSNQMKEYRKQVTKAFKKLEEAVGETSVRPKIVREDLKEVKSAKQRILKMIKEKTLALKTYHPGLDAPGKKAENVIRHISLLYNEILTDLNNEARVLFNLMLLTEYDMTH